MRKLRIVCDIDGILGDLYSVWLGQYNHDYDDSITVADLVHWDTHKIVKPECGEKVYEYLNENMFRNLPLIEGAEDALNKLIEDHEVHIVTAYSPKRPQAVVAKIEWVLEKFPKLNDRNIIPCSNKHIINCDVVIDDKPKTIKNFRKAYGYSTMICTIAYPYNFVVRDHCTVYAQSWRNTVKAWSDIYLRISSLA